MRHNIHLIFSPAGLGRVEVKLPLVELLAFREEGMDPGGWDGGLVGWLVGRLEEAELAQRLVGGLGEAIWLWRVGGEAGSVEKSVVGDLGGLDDDEQVVKRGHEEVGRDDDDGGQVAEQRDAQGGCREGVCRTRRGRGSAPGQEGTAQSAPPYYPTPGNKIVKPQKEEEMVF